MPFKAFNGSKDIVAKDDPYVDKYYSAKKKSGWKDITGSTNNSHVLSKSQNVVWVPRNIIKFGELSQIVSLGALFTNF